MGPMGQGPKVTWDQNTASHIQTWVMFGYVCVSIFPTCMVPVDKVLFIIFLRFFQLPTMPLLFSVIACANKLLVSFIVTKELGNCKHTSLKIVRAC